MTSFNLERSSHRSSFKIFRRIETIKTLYSFSTRPDMKFESIALFLFFHVGRARKSLLLEQATLIQLSRGRRLTGEKEESAALATRATRESESACAALLSPPLSPSLPPPPSVV